MLLLSRAPRGHQPAVAVQRPTAGWVVPVILVALALCTLLVMVDTVTTGSFTSPIAGALGACTILALGARHYAVGPTWFRRGNYIVVTTDLTSISVQNGQVRLTDSRQESAGARWFRPGRVRFPLAALQHNPALYRPLRAAMDESLQRGQVRVDDGARQAFGLAA